MAAQTDGSIGAGTHFVEASNLAAAFPNPRKLDLIQVVNSGGQVVWNLMPDGAVHTNPSSPMSAALLGQFSRGYFR
jgi:hypothetical protein